MMATSWTSNPTGLNTARSYLGGAGTTTISIRLWWSPSSPPNTAATEEYTITGTKNIKTVTVS
jgi:hypothetical protein